ncbi:hypothetical protein CG002_00435 [Mesoplasma florum]|uniref:hypothetical protein n=1 Tax=Mesoplasma florum TaxID=2151 RepID=UPI000D0961AC|nr:hypothetical protein [Mesoplasma florum]AVN64841.1 hypothetical protein CG002_00435 [Mesoplasma florum]
MAKDELKNLRKLRKEGLEKHYTKVNKELNSDIKSPENYYKMNIYHEKKKQNWITLLTILLITIVGISFSFGLGYALKNNSSVTITQNYFSATAFVATAYLFIEILVIFIINYARNKKAMVHFNDKRLRYQKTYNEEEAVLIRWRNAMVLSVLLFIIFTIVMYCV